ncbi:MAG: succinate dehydrogenase [Elusimicrobiota bacterium]
METKTADPSAYPTWNWLFIRASGLLLLSLALGHLYIMHIINSVETIDDNFVRKRLSSPVWITYDLLLLSLALAHGGLGVSNILEDHIRNKKTFKTVKIVLGIFCAALFILGLAIFIKKV